MTVVWRGRSFSGFSVIIIATILGRRLSSMWHYFLRDELKEKNDKVFI